MSKSTGSKGGDNNSKGSNTSSSSGSDSEGSKGSSSSTQGGNSGNSASQASSKAASEAAAKSAADAKANAESASKAGAEANARSAESQAQSQHEAAVANANAEQAKSESTYKGFVNGVLDAAPVGVENINKGRFGTELSDAEISNTLSEADHQFAANQAWNRGEYGTWASEKIGGLVDSVQGWGLAQAREITQAPMDKLADISRNPAARGLATVVGGLPGLALMTGVGIADSVSDYAQGEKTGAQAGYQGIGDVVRSFAPPGIQMAYNVVTDPQAVARQGIGMMVKTGNPIADMALQRGFSFASDNMIGGMDFSGSPRESGLMNSAMGDTLLASRSKADNSYSSRVEQTKGTYTKPVVMTSDALMYDWQRFKQQQANKPRYSSSLLFNMA